MMDHVANRKRPLWETLFKTEDWLTVWIGFLIILFVLAGLRFMEPKFRWITDVEFFTYISTVAPELARLDEAAREKNETVLANKLSALKAAAAKEDRKGIVDAARELETISKTVENESLKKSVAKLAKDISGTGGRTVDRIFSADNLTSSLIMAVVILAMTLIALQLMGNGTRLVLAGFPVVFAIAWTSLLLAGNHTVYYYGIEYVFWCLILGLFVSNVTGTPAWLKPAVRTEFYIKTGLVILGCRVLFGDIMKAGIYGIVQAVLVVIVVWYACYWLAKKLNVDDDMAAMLSSAVSICGVSAAIATAGAIKGDPKKLSYVTSITLLCAVPMLILQPFIAKTFSIPDLVSGAWLGGTLDTTASVVAAGALLSETAMKIGVIVKMSQNVLIGVVAFILSVIWTIKKKEIEGGGRPSAVEIWNRFPKFVLGFMISSVVFSFVLSPTTVASAKGVLRSFETMWFALAFTCIGLETHFGDLTKLGSGRPALAFLAAQGFNIFWTLILAYLFFGGIIFAIPKL
ncbi:MAG TPA: putative sulfate exporter family transporter [Syntrophales bacterium]|nr:putative sulfate exporter family transporter [Syntrophales bacterium]